jgi:hypothetical protein
MIPAGPGSGKPLLEAGHSRCSWKSRYNPRSMRSLVPALLIFLSFLDGCGIPEGSYLRIGGAARPEYLPSPLPLAEKARRFEEGLARHISPEGVNIYILGHGQTAERAVEEVALSDCAIWTGALLGAECFRLAATGDPEAREKVRRLTRGLHLLGQVTGVPGYFARCLARRTSAGPTEGGVWHAGTGEWASYRWKGDTSKDQYSGLVFGLSLAATLAGDPEVRQMAATDAAALADFLLRNHLEIVELDGKRTSFGDLRSHFLCIPLGVNALIALSAMKSAAAATGEPRFREAYADLVRRRYPQAGVWAKFQFFGRSNGNNDVMAMLSLFNLLRLEEDPSIREWYLKSCRRFRDYLRYDGNSLFNYIMAWGLRGEPGLLADARLTLELFPLEKRAFETDVSGRSDLERAFFKGWGGKPQALYPLPVNYRSQTTWVWRDNPRQLRSHPGADGSEESSPTDFLTAYWMGRYLGYLSERD